jgi:hypothetical protein
MRLCVFLKADQILSDAVVVGGTENRDIATGLNA